MNLDSFADLGYQVSDEDFVDLKNDYERISINELKDGDEITGKPYAELFLADEDYKSDSMAFHLLSEDEEGTKMSVDFYCQIPKPTEYTPDDMPLTTVYKNKSYDKNTYWVIYSILKLQGYKNINDANGNPVNSFKHICVSRYLEILSEQKEITIIVKNTNQKEYKTLEIIDIKE